MKCPKCGISLHEIPFTPCSYHRAHAADEEEAERRKLAARPMSQKIQESQDFEELKEHLHDWFLDQEN